MLTGKRAFEGDEVSDVLASVLKSEPQWDAVPPTWSVPDEYGRGTAPQSSSAIAVVLNWQEELKQRVPTR